MSHRLAFCVASVLGLSASVAQASEIYVDRRAGADGNEGLSPDDAVRSIADGMARAEPGDTVVVAEGTYRETVRMQTEGVRLIAAGEVVLEPALHGIIVEATGVEVDGFVIRGGAASGTALDVRAGGEVVATELWMESVDGTGVRVEGAGARLAMSGGGVQGARGLAVSVGGGGSAVLQDTLLRGFRFDDTPAALVQVSGADAALTLDHSLVTGAARSCVRGLDGARLVIEDSIVGVCGVENDITMNVYAVVQATDAEVSVRRSLLSGQPNAPHERVVSGRVELDGDTLFNGRVRYAGHADAVGFLSITVDDSPNLGHAMALSTVLDEVGGHLSFFANFPENLSYAQQGDLIDLVDRGHEVGGHAVTNGRLTEVVPLELSWSGPEDAWLHISDDGATLTVGTVAPWLTLDLEDPATDTLHEVCTALETLDSLGCTVVSDDPSALPIYANPTGLSSGTFSLSAGTDLQLEWDRRLASEGGRHFHNELVAPRLFLSSVLDQPVTSLAYPGQKHDAWVREAAADAGFLIGRGSTGYTQADHRYDAPVDVMQAPISLTATAVRGEGYASLDADEQQERVRAFARTWAAFAQEAGGMGALTVHAAETLDVHEVAWLVDEVAGTGLRLWTVGEVGAWLRSEGTELEDGLWQGPAHRFDDYRPAVGSDAIDRGSEAGVRVTDALGQPIYGAPDAGPFEHQPTGIVAVDRLPVGTPVTVYADGRFVNDGLGEAELHIEPMGGWPELEAEEPRGVWARVEVSVWSADRRSWRMEDHAALEPTCASVGALPPASTWLLSVNGLEAGVVGVAVDGSVSVELPEGATELSLVPVEDAGDQPSATRCTPAIPGTSETASVQVGSLAPGPLALVHRPMDTAERSRATSGCSAAGTRGFGGVAVLLVALAGLGLRRRRES